MQIVVHDGKKNLSLKTVQKSPDGLLITQRIWPLKSQSPVTKVLGTFQWSSANIKAYCQRRSCGTSTHRLKRKHISARCFFFIFSDLHIHNFSFPSLFQFTSYSFLLSFQRCFFCPFNQAFVICRNHVLNIYVNSITQLLFCVEVPLSNGKLCSTRNSYFKYSFCITHYDIIYFSHCDSYRHMNY